MNSLVSINLETPATQSAPEKKGAISENALGGALTDRPVIFNFLDYREYLNAFYLFKKSSQRGYSYAVFSHRAGMASPNYLKLVMSGARNLTNEKILQFAKAMDLTDYETVYWENLVDFNQAKRPEQKRYTFMKLSNSPLPPHLQGAGSCTLREIRDEWDYFSSWHHAAIRELVLFPDFQESPARIAELLKNRVSSSQAKESLELLQRLKFLERATDGKLRQTNRQVRYLGAQGVRNLVIQKYHESTARLALDSIQKDSVNECNFSGLMIALDHPSIEAVTERITQFRKSLNEEFSLLKSAYTLVHIGFQLVQVSPASSTTSSSRTEASSQAKKGKLSNEKC